MVIISSRVCWGYGGLKLKNGTPWTLWLSGVWLRGVCAVRCGYGCRCLTGSLIVLCFACFAQRGLRGFVVVEIEIPGTKNLLPT